MRTHICCQKLYKLQCPPIKMIYNTHNPVWESVMAVKLSAHVYQGSKSIKQTHYNWFYLHQGGSGDKNLFFSFLPFPDFFFSVCACRLPRGNVSAMLDKYLSLFTVPSWLMAERPMMLSVCSLLRLQEAAAFPGGGGGGGGVDLQMDGRGWSFPLGSLPPKPQLG